MTDLNPQPKQMADESMVRNLDAQAHRTAAWIGWWSLSTAASRVLMTWLYNNTGKSVFAAALYHDISSLGRQLFPNYGSHCDPRISGLIVALTATIIAVVWGPETLARNRSVE